MVADWGLGPTRLRPEIGLSLSCDSFCFKNSHVLGFMESPSGV